MICRSLSDSKDRVTFREALFAGMGRDRALYMPESWPRLKPAEMDELLALDFVERSARLTTLLLSEEFGAPACERIARKAFSFPVPMIPVGKDTFALELFHGPTLAFKDFGARFMACCMAEARRADPPGRVTVLCATSGDTGAAVAHAFHGVEGIRVVVLYPAGRISPIQEGQMVSLGENVRALAVEGSFDDCQRLVKGAFQDRELRERVGLTTANSINLGRLIPQTFYYHEAVARLRSAGVADGVLISVPSGNFGNLAAGLLAWRMGLPVAGFVAATNANDAVPRLLSAGKWEPRPTVSTFSNAMDVGDPGNWPRVESLFRDEPAELSRVIRARAVGDDETLETIGRGERETGYVLDPHGAVAYAALSDLRREGETGIFLATAHPAKFIEVMRRALGRELPLPPELARALSPPRQGGKMVGTQAALRALLVEPA